MATGRTVSKWVRCYVDGRNLSGYGRTIGPLTWDYDLADLTCQMSDAVRGGLPVAPPGQDRRRPAAGQNLPPATRPGADLR